MSDDSDFAVMAARLKKVNDDSKRNNLKKLENSSSQSDRDLAAKWKQELQSDTSTMVVGNKGAQRIDLKSGKPVGKPMRKNKSTGAYEDYAKGGIVRGHGCEKQGKTRGKFK